MKPMWRIMLIFWVAAVALLGITGYVALRASSAQVEENLVAFDVSPNGRQVVFSSAQGNLFLLDLQGRRVRRLTASAALETQPAFSPDGKEIVYCASARPGEGTALFICSLDGTRTRRLTPGEATDDSAPSYSRDGKQIVFARAALHRPYSMGGWTWDHYDVYVINQDGTGLRRVTHGNYYGLTRPWFMDGGHNIVFSASGTYPDVATYLFTVPADGSRPPQRLTPPTRPPAPIGASSACASWGSSPAVAPDASRLVFVSDRGQSYHYDLWVMGTGGGESRSLHVTGISSYNDSPVFTSDGQQVLFLAGTQWNASSRPIYSLWEVGADGSHPHRLADETLFINPLRWKP